ncbi:MAG TPA: VanZ family protein [Burkholderiales bacterium]|nr:VanZ family protein [Burkholderiales bacterium]
MRASPLARILWAVFVLLTAYATLYPAEGWRAPGGSPFAYLTAPWPRYVTRFDVVANILGYVPYGFFAAAALLPHLRGPAAFALAALSGAALAASLEALQSFLPARFESLLDVLCNTLGAAIGAALGVRFAPALLGGPVGDWRQRAFLPGSLVDLGLVLVGLWLFIQLNPATLLFGAGDLRELIGARPASGQAPPYFIANEALIAAVNLTAVGLLLSGLAAPGAARRLQIAALTAAALAVKTLAFAILMQTQDVLDWLTPGAQAGILAGLAAAALLAGLPRVVRLALAAMLIMAATVLVNLAPPNPYLAATLKVWQQGHFLNFNGLTRLVSVLWPFAALGYLMMLAARRPREST